LHGDGGGIGMQSKNSESTKKGQQKREKMIIDRLGDNLGMIRQ